jgi:hypothetical protein
MDITEVRRPSAGSRPMDTDAYQASLRSATPGFYIFLRHTPLSGVILHRVPLYSGYSAFKLMTRGTYNAILTWTFYALQLENYAFAQEMIFLKNVLKWAILPIESGFIKKSHASINLENA